MSGYSPHHHVTLRYRTTLSQRRPSVPRECQQRGRAASTCYRVRLAFIKDHETIITTSVFTLIVMLLLLHCY